MPALCVSTATVALPVPVIAEADGLSGSQRRLVGGLLGSHVAAGHEAVNLGQDPLEGGVDKPVLQPAARGHCGCDRAKRRG